MGRVAGKKAFITGGAQGLGACFARMLADEGAKVFVTDINEHGARASAATVNKNHVRAASSIRHDVTSRDDWDKKETFGPEVARRARAAADSCSQRARPVARP